MRLLKGNYGLFIIFAVLGFVVIALALFVQRNTTSISDALAAEVLEQQSDVAILLHEYDRLILALESERIAGEDPVTEPVVAALLRTEQQLEEMRFNYSFERLDGASTAHAYIQPVIEDVREWLTKGIPGAALDRQQAVAVASARVLERHNRLRDIATETYDVAGKLVNTQTSYIDRFGTSLMFMLAAFALLAAGIASLLTRQRDLQTQLAEDQRQHAQRIKDFADTGADWFWEINKDMRLRWLSSQTLSGSSRYFEDTASDRQSSLPAYAYELGQQDWPFEELKRRISFNNYEAQWLTRDGEVKKVAVSGKPLFNATGEFEGYRGIGRDITVRKQMESKLEAANKGLIEAEIKGRQQAEQALRDSEMFLRTSLNALPENLAILNEHGLIIEVNNAWRDYAQSCQLDDQIIATGTNEVTVADRSRCAQILPEGGGIGWHYSEIFIRKSVAESTALSEIAGSIDAVLQGQRDKFRTEVSIINGENTQWLAIALSPFYSTGSRYCVLAMEVVTDRKKLEEQDRQLRADLAHFSRLTTIGGLATGLAHELNQPLTAISHNCDAVLSGIENNNPLDDTDIEAIHAIHSEADRAGAIIKGLRKMVSKETGGVAKTDINQLVTETIRLSMPEAKRHGINVILDLATDLPHPEIDAIQIQQVLVNLERNAVDAIKAAGSTVRQMVVSTRELENGLIRVTVQDSGEGLSAEVRDGLFNPFLTTKKDGMGMGLSISRSLVESHGGQLWVDFTGPSVTTFHFTLPILAWR